MSYSAQTACILLDIMLHCRQSLISLISLHYMRDSTGKQRVFRNRSHALIPLIISFNSVTHPLPDRIKTSLTTRSPTSSMCIAVTSTNDNNSVMQYDKINVVVSVALRQTNNRKVVGSMTANVVCITVHS